jgi:hypothetical protein
MADLITLDIYKQAKAITTSKDDERLSLLVPAVSQLVKTYCGNSFIDYYANDYTEYITNDWTTDFIQVTESPLNTITSLSERSGPTEDYTALVENTDFVVNNRTDGIIRIGTNWPVGVNAVKVIYKAGYAAVPVDLQLALVDLIHYYMHSEYKPSKSLGSGTVNNITTSSIVANVGFPDHIKRILDMYRQI